METTKNNFIETYTPILELFIKSISEAKFDNISEPHLPVIGRRYDYTTDKILFMGWETRGSKGLKEFINTAKEKPTDALCWWDEDFDSLEFVNWRSNFSKDFWSFNLQFLAKFYGIENWKDLIKEPYSYDKILSGFAWANTNSIERFEVTAQNNGVLYENWKIVHDASDIFNRPPVVFNTLQPNLTILMHWDQDEKSLFDGLEIEKQSKPIPQYLWHYKIKKPDMHLFWTKHPLRLHFEGVDYSDIIDRIIDIYRSY